MVDDLFIGGDWVAAHGPGRLPVLDPFTEQTWTAVPDADAQDVDRAVRAARAALPGWARLTPSERAGYLVRIADEVDKRADEMTRTITRENGTPVAESSHAAGFASAFFKLTAALAADLERPDVRPNPFSPGRSVVQRRPVGVAGLITPWNYPTSLIVIKLAPALLAGSTVVLKPAPETPIAARQLVEAVAAAGVPDGVVNLVTGGVATGEALLAHPGVDKISFTGSTAVGRHVGEVCGRMLRPVTLELGGKSPAVVLDDADLDVVAAHILKVAMRNTGQTCKACTRLLVPASRQHQVVERVAAVVASAPMGDPSDPKTFFGPLVSDRQRARVNGYLDDGLAAGARAVVGGGRPATEHGFFVEPTVFTDVTPDMRIVREEIFGPVLVVQTYTDVDDAVRLANDSDYGLAAAVFGVDEDRAAAVADRLETGNVGINHYGSNAAAPFGGHKNSGLGTEFAVEGVAQYQLLTSIHYPS